MPRRNRALRKRRSAKGISRWSMWLSSGRVACLGKSNIARNVRRLHGPTGERAGAAVDGVSHFDADLRFARKPNVHTRAESDKADPLAANYRFSGLFPRDNTPGNEPRDLFELD